jgi:hypothetical protein
MHEDELRKELRKAIQQQALRSMSFRYDPAADGGNPRPWTPFKKDGKLRVTTSSDPWWKRALARLRRQPIWHKIGTIRED